MTLLTQMRGFMKPLRSKQGALVQREIKRNDISSIWIRRSSGMVLIYASTCSAKRVYVSSWYVLLAGRRSGQEHIWPVVLQLAMSGLGHAPFPFTSFKHADSRF